MRKNFRRLSPPIVISASVAKWRNVVGSSDNWLHGNAIERFEARLAELADVDPACVVATDTCTNALAAAGHVLFGRGPVFVHVCPLTYAGTYSWVTPDDREGEGGVSWVDCHENGLPVGPVDVSVELWGLSDVAGAPIVDAAHRFRPEEVQRHFRAGTKAVCWSFGPMKEVPGVRGGAVVFKDEAAVGHARAFLNNGIVKGCPRGAPGRKGLMPNADAAFLETQLRAAPKWGERRQAVLSWYDRFFPAGPGPVATLMTRPGAASGHLCVLRFANRERRDAVRHDLERTSIDTSIHYPVPDYAPEGTKALSDRILSVPCHPEMRFHDVNRISNLIIKTF